MEKQMTFSNKQPLNSEIIQYNESKVNKISYQSMVQEAINNRATQILFNQSSTQSIRSNSRPNNQRRGRSQRKERSNGPPHQGSVSPETSCVQANNYVTAEEALQPSIIQHSVKDIDSQLVKEYHSGYTTNKKTQVPNIHYGENGKFIDVKSPCQAGKVSHFINQSLRKSGINEDQIFAQEFNTSNYKKYIRNMDNDENFGSLSRNSPNQVHANTQQELQLVTNYSSQLQVSRFVLPDNQMMSPDHFETCLSQPQFMHTQTQIEGTKPILDVIHTPKHLEFGSSNGTLSVDKKSNKSRKSTKSKGKKSRRKSKQQSRVSEDFEFGGSYFNPDSALIPQQNGFGTFFQSGTSSSHDEQVTKVNVTKRKKSGKSGKKKIKNANLSQFILSPGSQQHKKKKSIKKQNIERIHSEANELTQAQLDQILMSPQSQHQCYDGKLTRQESQDQFTFNMKAKMKSHSKSKSTKKSRVKKETFGPTQATISSFAMGTQDATANDEVQPHEQEEENLELATKKNSVVSKTQFQNSPTAVISLVPKKIETSQNTLKKQFSKQVLQQNRLLGNIMSTPIRRNRDNRLGQDSNSSQKKMRLYTNDSEYLTAEEQEKTPKQVSQCNENAQPAGQPPIEELSGCQMKKHQSLSGLFKIQSETKTSILHYGQINLEEEQLKEKAKKEPVASPGVIKHHGSATPKKPTHLKNKLSSSKYTSSVNIQSPFSYNKVGGEQQQPKIGGGLNKYGSQKYFKQSNLSKHLTKKSMPNIVQELNEMATETEKETFETAGIKSDDIRHDVVHKRKSSNIQEYIQLRANHIAGSVLGQNTSTYPSRGGASQTKQAISATYKPKKTEQSKSSSDLNLNFSQRMLKKTPNGQKNGMSQSSSGLNFENLKSLKTMSGGALSGALSTVNKSGTMAGVSQISSTGLKTSSTQQATLRGKPSKQNFFTSQSKKNLNEMESAFQSGSLEEKETTYQQSKNSSQSFNRGNSDNFKFKDNMSGRSSKEASLENILEQEDDIIDLQMGDDSYDAEQQHKEELSLEQVDVNFKSEEEDQLLNPRSNILGNSKTVGVKAKMDKKYTSTKNSITGALMGSMTKKTTTNLAYQIPIARKSQFRNKRPSDSTNIPLQILGSLKKPQSSFNQDLEVGSPNKMIRDLEKSASKPGAYAQQLLMAHRQDGRNRVRTQVRTGLQAQYSRGSSQLNDQLILERQRELKESLKAKLEQKTRDKDLTKATPSSCLSGAQATQSTKNSYPSRPGTSLQETREASKLKSSEKTAQVSQLRKETRSGILGVKKQSLPYTNSTLIMQTKTGTEESKGEVEMTGHHSSKAKPTRSTLAKLGATRNGSQSRQPPHKTVATGSYHVNGGQGTSTNFRISSTYKQTLATGPSKQNKASKTPITAAACTATGRTGGSQVQKYQLLDSEKEKYGDRCPAGYKKIDLLGKGGIALVWLAESKDSSRQKVALKQFPKTRGQPLDSSAKIEIETLSTLFPLESTLGCDGHPERGYAMDPEENPGIKSIARLIDQIEDKQDFWLVYEVGSKCLGKHLAEVKGEFYKGERIYNVAHQGFYKALSKNHQILVTFIRKIAEIFDVLSSFGIVHSDIKPDNILVQLNQNGSDIEEIKLIDFGSAFQFHNVTQITGTTPEYLAPEVLDYLEQRSKNQKSNIASAVSLNKACQPWSFDVWSLGIILLEIITGFPVWMSLKCRVTTATGKSLLGSGLFGVQGREGKRIMTKQQQVLKNLPATLKKFECYGLDQDQDFMDLLNRMLDWNASRRIAPSDIIEHPFCCSK